MDNPQPQQSAGKTSPAVDTQTSNSKYRVEVKRDLCIGAASCVAIAPETFSLDDENIAIVKVPAGNPDETLLMAAQACPTKAIYIHDKDGKQVWPE